MSENWQSKDLLSEVRMRRWNENGFIGERESDWSGAACPTRLIVPHQQIDQPTSQTYREDIDPRFWILTETSQSALGQR